MSKLLVLVAAGQLAFVAPLLAAAPLAAAPPLAGNWAGDGFAMRSTPTGMIVQGRCASGKIAHSILPDATGAFIARGYYNAQTSGLSLSDIAPTDQPADFTGKVSGKTLDLTLKIAGKPDTRYSLRRDAKIKFPKCNALRL